MLTLEMAIEKIHQLPPKQRDKVIEFVELLDSQTNPSQPENLGEDDRDTQEFLKLAGIWKDRDITADSIRRDAWRKTQS